jgi:RNA polymerase sigma factor (sigma-70 family)
MSADGALDVDSLDSGSVTSVENDLFRRVVSGDRTAFRSLFQQHQRSVYWAAFSVLLSRPDSEDVVQEAFILMWNKRLQIELVGDSALPWLVTTARYLALNNRRSTQRRATDSLEAAPDDIQTTPGSDAAVVASEFSKQLGAVVGSLSEVDQELFRLCLLEDLSYTQAARRLGISHGSVRNRLSRLKLRLRGELELLRGKQ